MENAIPKEKPPLLVDTEAFRKGLQKTCENLDMTPQKQIERAMGDLEEKPMPTFYTKLKNSLSPDAASWMQSLFNEKYESISPDRGSNFNGRIDGEVKYSVDTFISKENNNFIYRKKDNIDTHRLTKTLERSLRDSLDKLSQIKLNNKQEKKELEIKIKDLKEEMKQKANKRQLELEDELQKALETLKNVRTEKDEIIRDLEKQLTDANTLNAEINQDKEERQNELETELRNIIDTLHQEKLEQEEKIKTLERQVEDVQISSDGNELLSLRNYTEMLEQINSAKTDEIKVLEGKLKDARTECETSIMTASEMKSTYDEVTAELEKQVYQMNTRMRLLKLQNECFIEKQEEQLSNERETVLELREKLSNNITATRNLDYQLKKVGRILANDDSDEEEQQDALKESLQDALYEFEMIHQTNAEFEATFEKQGGIISEKIETLNDLRSNILLQNTERVFFEPHEIASGVEEKLLGELDNEVFQPGTSLAPSQPANESQVNNIKNKILLGITNQDRNIRLAINDLGSGIMGSVREFKRLWNKTSEANPNPNHMSDLTGTDIDDVGSKTMKICGEGIEFIENQDLDFSNEVMIKDFGDQVSII